MSRTMAPVSDSRPATEPEYKARPMFVALIMGVLLTGVPLIVGLIYWRWATIHEPTTAVVIVGDVSLDGAVVAVSNSEHRRWVVELDRGNFFQSPVLLDPGKYHINVTHRKHDIIDEDFTVERLRGLRFDLPSLVWIMGGASLADAKIEVMRDSDRLSAVSPMEIKLTSRDHYRQFIYVTPGTYRVIAHSTTGADRILANAEFVVDRTSVVRVDLTKAAPEDGSGTFP